MWKGSFAFPLGTPLVEAGRRDQAPTLLEGVAERRLRCDPVGPGVDQLVADLEIIGPERHEAPSQPTGCSLALFLANRQDLLRRSDVVARRDLAGALEQIEGLSISAALAVRLNRPHMT
jgi:hypothetical protein